MNENIRTLLERAFSAEQIKQRQGNFGAMLDYIEAHEIIQRLNDAFEGNWNFEITWQHIGEEEVLVMGRITAEGVIKEQFGSSKITRHRDDNSIISLGDDLKSGATDALKKCATLLGVGLHLYRKDPPAKQNNSNQRDKGNGNGNGRNYNNGDNGGNGNGNGSGRTRLTNKQLQAIFSIGKSKSMTQKAIKDFTIEVFNKVPDYLSKEEASTIIQELQNK